MCAEHSSTKPLTQCARWVHLIVLAVALPTMVFRLPRQHVDCITNRIQGAALNFDSSKWLDVGATPVEVLSAVAVLKEVRIPPCECALSDALESFRERDP